MRTFSSQLWQDIRYAARTMAASPVFTGMAVLSLALGIGANTAIYSFMEAILMRSLPVAEPQSLVLFAWHSKDFPKVSHSFNGNNYRDPNTGFTSGNFPFPAWERLKETKGVLSGVFAFNNGGKLNVLGEGTADLAESLYVSGDFFRTLGLSPAAGRLLDGNDDAAAVVVLSEGYARRRFGDTASAVGKTLRINSEPFTVAGVAPADFHGISPGSSRDLYLPLRSAGLLATNPTRFAGRYTDANSYWIEIMGRLRPGVARERAQAELAAAFRGFVEPTATTAAERADLPALILQDGAGGLGNLRRRYSRPLLVLMTMVGFLLAIACANVANLLLARAASRRREIALRLSLGAGRWRVIRQLLTESVALSAAGGILGVLFAWWGIRGLTLMISNGRPDVPLGAGLNWNVLAVTVGLSVATGLLFGLAPALQSTRLDLSSAIKQMRAGDFSARRSRRLPSLPQLLVASQIAISVLLVVAAGLFGRTLANLHSVELGFNSEKLLVVSLNARQMGYRDESLARFYDGLRGRFAAIPGVRAVTASDMVLATGSMSSTSLAVPGYSGRDASSAFLRTGPGFFSAMQIPLLLGRDFTERDNNAGARTAIVNEAFAKKYFPGQSPLGRRFGLGSQKDLEIVGVARPARYQSLKGEIPVLVYLPYGSAPESLGGLNFEIRAAGDPLALAAAVRREVAQADARVPVGEISTQQLQIEQAISGERTFATLCSGFALLAMAIACVGLYGSMAYTVARRTGEIGIRMALGGQRGRIVGLVLRDVWVMTALGLGAGLSAAWISSRLLESFLFGLKARDPLVFSAAGLILLAAALAAGIGPARRAARIDPWTALREE